MLRLISVGRLYVLVKYIKQERFPIFGKVDESDATRRSLQ